MDRNAILAYANSLIGTKEIGVNRGAIIDAIEKEFGLQGEPYCAMFAIHCITKTNSSCKIIKTASSQTLWEWAAKKGITYTDPKLLTPGDLVVWRKLKLWKGHVGIVAGPYDEESHSFRTIEGNTSSGKKGSQDNGNGIYKRARFAGASDWTVDAFYLRGFINIDKI
jgi:hypothetical protein